MPFTNELNENQTLAATTFAGPIMVFAGAGSGKTRTLTYRIANMIEAGIPAYHILAITFTNKATNEMKERLNGLVGIHTKYLTISTFHSLCARILRQEIHLLGYKKNFDIIDEEEQLKIITDVLAQANIDKKKFTPKHCRKMINFNKCFNMKPDNQIEGLIFNKYEETMKELNVLDFEDLLIKTYEIFKISVETLDKYRDKYQYILVDEFQDTNLIQYRILHLLSIKHRNLFVVGDDDQSIYSFRGTNYENMVLFKKEFSEYKQIILNQNYRSRECIVKGANKLIANNKNRQSKDLFSDIRGYDNDITIIQLRDERDEVTYVANEILNAIKNDNKSYKDFAILYRSSVISRNFELGLIQHGIPYRIFGGISYLRRKEIKDVTAYLKFILNNNDIISFKRIVNEPARGIGLKTMQTVLDYKREFKMTIFDSIDAMRLVLPSKYDILQKFKKMIEELSDFINDTPLDEFFEILLDKTNYFDALEGDDDEEERKENLMEFKSILRTIENNGELATREEKLIEAFDEAILSDDKLQNQRQSNDGVTISTVHSVKGLEFDTVFLVAFENGLFPNFFNSGDNNDEEEERRIAYVAITRARNKLYLTCANKRLIYGDIRNHSQSKFLLEFIGEREQSKPKTIKVEKILAPVIDAPKDASVYKVGDYVIHNMYGEGIIVSLDSKVGKICFTAQGSIKTFDMTHPSITKK